MSWNIHCPNCSEDLGKASEFIDGRKHFITGCPMCGKELEYIEGKHDYDFILREDSNKINRRKYNV